MALRTCYLKAEMSQNSSLTSMGVLWRRLDKNRSQYNTACFICQARSFSDTPRRRKLQSDAAPKASEQKPSLPSPLEGAPRAHGKQVTEYTPQPLSRPIGLPNPPKAGQNSGLDKRTWRQRWNDYFDYDKHLARRQILNTKMSTPYFREWTNMRLHKGKSFYPPPRLFKGDKALYFPNLQGQTLLKGAKLQDTTPIVKDKITIISIFSSAWGERQASTFASMESHAALHEVVRESSGSAQMVQINVEENGLKAMLIKVFMPSLRKSIGRDNWGRYFLVTRGLNSDVRDAIGLLNSKVGYTFLLDKQCRVRWAGSGDAGVDEKAGLLRGVKKLIEDEQLTMSQQRNAERQVDSNNSHFTAKAINEKSPTLQAVSD